MELKPCPFCGGKAKEEHKAAFAWIEEQAAEAWNRRADNG